MVVLFLAIFGLIFCLSACDCCDDDGNGSALNDDDEGMGVTVYDETLATVDQATAENALGILFVKGAEDIPVDDIIDQFSGLSSKPAMFLRDWALNQVKTAFLSGTIANRKSDSLEGSIALDGTCASGSYQASGSWTGPDMPSSLNEVCEISDVAMSITLTECQEFGVTANGQASLTLAGSVCSPESLNVDFTDFTIKESKSNTQISLKAFNMATDVKLFDGFNMVHVVSTMNGDMAIDNVSTEYKDYTEDATFSMSGMTLNTSGAIKGSCIDGWISIDTVSPVKAKYGDCPNSGSIKLSANGDVTATFNSDGSITMGETSYASCADVPEACQDDVIVE
jgi:hypothetical protein